LLLKHAPYKITSSIGENQSIYKVTIRKEGNIVLEERGDLDGTMLENGDEWKPFGKCKLAIYFFPGRSRYEDWNKYYKKAMNINNIINTLTEIHGVKLYRDGFWVRPYGDLGNDWLSLERERVQANYKLGNSQVIGFVQISKDQNPSVIDTTTRERLVENAGFHSMRTFVKTSIDIVSNYRKELNRKLKQKQTKKNYRNLIESEIKHFKELIEDSESLTVDDKKKFNRSLKDITDVYTDYEQDSEEELTEAERSQRVFRNLASLGISSATTSHEIGHVISHLGQLPKQILNKLQKESKAKALVEQDLKATLERINIVRYFMTFINEFVRSIANDSEVKQKKERIYVKSIIGEYVKELSGILRMNDLTIQLKVDPPNLSVYMNGADFSSIILNLFSNSLKALQKLKKGIPRKVKITIYKDTRNFKIKFSDNGIGIKPTNREKVFRLFYTTNNRGTGLGLPIVKEILEDYGGTIKLDDYSELDEGATFLVAVPLEGLKE